MYSYPFTKYLSHTNQTDIYKYINLIIEYNFYVLFIST